MRGQRGERRMYAHVYGALTPAEAERRRRTCQCCGWPYRSAVHAELCPELRQLIRGIEAVLREARAQERATRPLAAATLRRNRYRRGAA